MPAPSKPNELTLKDLNVRVTDLEKWPKRLIGAYGITLTGLLAFAFFLGSLYTKVSDTSEKVDKLYGVVAIDKDNLLSRTTVLETRLTAVESRLTSLESKLTSMDGKLNSLDTKLTDLAKSFDRSAASRRSRENR